MVDGTCTTTYSYDAVNRLTSATFPTSRTVGYTYSNAGNRATVTHLGTNTVTYGYDEANNLTSVTDWNSNQTTYSYDNAGRLTTATLPSGTGIVGSFSYDNADRLTGIDWVKGGSTTVASASYTLDASGNRTQRVDQAGTHSYSYDALYRLTQVTYPDPATDSFTYDAVGNRLSKNSTSYSYDAADRLTAVGSTSYTYDSNGNMTARGSDSFSWDAADRLTSATVGGTTTTFAYNGDGLRDSFTTGGVTTTSTWDILAGLPQELYYGTMSYVYGIGRVSEVDSSDNTYYYLPDALGSTMALCDASGNVVDSYDYDVFGSVRSSSGSQANPFTYTGERTDSSTGLEYLRARYYDAAVGSFISRDPLATPNRYAYAGGNPILFVDPSGMCISKKVIDAMRDFIAEHEPKLGEGKIPDIIRAFWETSLEAAEKLLCSVEKAARSDEAKQCALWGTMALLGGADPEVSLLACLAAAASTGWNPKGDNPGKQCAAWAISGIKGGIYGVVLGCVTGATSSLLPENSPAQCIVWGYGGILAPGPRPTPGEVNRGRAGGAACIAGGLGPIL